MKQLYIYIAFASFTLCFCGRHEIFEPRWINVSDTLASGTLSLEFEAHKNMEAILYTSAQPLMMQKNTIGLVTHFTLPANTGIIEGQAKVCVLIEDVPYFYSVFLINKQPVDSELIEFRSPKTVNPDSSLIQQKMLYRVNKYRNLTDIDSLKGLFFEENITLSPKAGVFQSIPNNDLSSYYVQPGSCVDIPLQIDYSPERNNYNITAGPLRDKFSNPVSNGTQVNFIFLNNKNTARVESKSWNGFAKTESPPFIDTSYFVLAQIGNTFSNRLKIKP